MKLLITILMTVSFLSLTACGDDSQTETGAASSTLFGNLEITCGSESCL